MTTTKGKKSEADPVSRHSLNGHAKKGRPSKRTDERVQIILDAIADGMPRESAAALAGISKSTLQQWMVDNSDFSDCIEKADAEAEKRHVDNIKQQADKGNVTASIFWLKTRRRENWGERQGLEITSDAAPLRVTLNLGGAASDL